MPPVSSAAAWRVGGWSAVSLPQAEDSHLPGPKLHQNLVTLCRHIYSRYVYIVSTVDISAEYLQKIHLQSIHSRYIYRVSTVDISIKYPQ